MKKRNHKPTDTTAVIATHEGFKNPIEMDAKTASAIDAAAERRQPSTARALRVLTAERRELADDGEDW